MAISVDASVTRWTGTPSGTTAITSASFTPPSGSLLVLCINGDENQSAPNGDIVCAAVTSGLTWTSRIVRGHIQDEAGYAGIFTAPVVTGAAMTVAVNRSSGNGGTNRLSCKVYVVTGQDASPIGQSNSARWDSDPENVAITATVGGNGGRLFGCGTDYSQTGTPTSTDTADGGDYAGAISAVSVFKAADHAAGSGSQQINFNPVGTPTGNAVVLEILAGAGGSTESTITPGKATLTLAGNAATANAFTNVLIKEVLINEAGSPVANRTGMSLLVWYGGSPVGAPDLSYSALTTDAAGTASWTIAAGSLIYNQTIFYVATDGGASLSMYTCARMMPTYS